MVFASCPTEALAADVALEVVLAEALAWELGVALEVRVAEALAALVAVEGLEARGVALEYQTEAPDCWAVELVPVGMDQAQRILALGLMVAVVAGGVDSVFAEAPE